MPIPKVAIVGRPNVGKSSLFNWLAGRRLAIVDDFEGVTRDRMTTLIRDEDEDYAFELIDTGGLGIDDPDDLTADVRHQIELAINSADVILLVVDVQTGLMPLDEMVAERLRGLDRPVILVANKSDQPHQDNLASEFHRFGRGIMITVSTTQNRNRSDLLELIVERLPPSDQTVADPSMKVTIVGRRNVGKSTFVNTLAETDRMIVSEVAGTTRDSVDVHFEIDGQTFIAIDTPGLRKRKSQRTDLEFYGMHRAQRSIRRADVVLMFFDGNENASKVDKQLIGYVIDNYKPCIFVVNKWDLLKDTMPTERWVRYLRRQFPTLAYAPIAFITGQTGKNVKTLLNHATMLYKQSQERVSTGQLNRLLRSAISAHQPPTYQNRRPKLYYATQVGTEPPTIVVMCNDPKAFGNDYRRYLLSVLRDHLSFGEVPIKMYLEKRGRNDDEDVINRRDN
ncbi:MAG: ribosome biogenesis GTPase Der [Rhodopirellula sp. TMED11]|nr:MAG: ribosome biogenesis GTPase Der [Rhodopirellula sp. TMED11]